MKFKKYSNARRLNEGIKANIPENIDKALKRFRVKIEDFRVVKFNSGEIEVNIKLDFGNDVKIVAVDDLRDETRPIPFEVEVGSWGRTGGWDDADQVFNIIEGVESVIETAKNAARVLEVLQKYSTTDFIA